jgi:hypothetical protein
VTRIVLTPEAESTYYLYKNGTYYSKVIGTTYVDQWVNAAAPEEYELWQYRAGVPVGSQRFSVDTTVAGLLLPVR